MEKKRRLNDATPEEWTAAFYNFYALERENQKHDLENLEKGLNGMSYDDFTDKKHEWDNWKPIRDLE